MARIGGFVIGPPLDWQEDCKVEILTAKDAKSAKEMLAMGIFQGVLLGALGVLGGSIRFMGLCSSPVWVGPPLASHLCFAVNYPVCPLHG